MIEEDCNLTENQKKIIEDFTNYFENKDLIEEELNKYIENYIPKEQPNIINKHKMLIKKRIINMHYINQININKKNAF